MSALSGPFSVFLFVEISFLPHAVINLPPEVANLWRPVVPSTVRRYWLYGPNLRMPLSIPLWRLCDNSII